MKNITFALLLLSLVSISVGAQNDIVGLNADTVTVVSEELVLAGDTVVDDTTAVDSAAVDSVVVETADTLSLSVDTIPAKEPVEVVLIATDASGVKDLFSRRLDSIVARFDTLDVDLSNVDGSERTNPTFVRIYMRPTLYRSVLGENFYKDASFDGDANDSQMGVDAKRKKIIDGLLLELYKNNPSRVWATEDEINKEVTTNQTAQQISGITLNTIQPIAMPDALTGDLKTKVVKPNYWRTTGGFGINYTQNFFSDNWRSGGENTKNMLVNAEFKLNYDDKKKIKFENHLEAKLGFYTSPSDTVHSIKTNQDLLRFTTKLGYQGWKNIYYSVKAQVWTQFLPFYDANQSDFRSNFMAPFNANFSFGIDFKPNLSKGTLSIYCAPLSAYNYRFVRYGDLAVSHYGIRKGRHHYEDFGTNLEVNGTFQLLKNLSWKTRLYFYTTYSRVEHDWENTFSFSFNRYISASMFIHSRFDDKARSQFSDEFGYWQIYQNMMIGLTYSW